MAINQISVFLENNAGRLYAVTRCLSEADVNLRAISIADTADFGILRLVVDKEAAALDALAKQGFTTRVTEVTAVEIEDKPGALSRIMEYLAEANVNIEYLYASLEGKAGKAVTIFKLSDCKAGQEALKAKGVSMAAAF